MLIDRIWGLRKPKEFTGRIELPFIEIDNVGGRIFGEKIGSSFLNMFDLSC